MPVAAALLTVLASALPPTAEPGIRELRGSTLFAVDPATGERYPTVVIPYRPGAICYQWVVFVAPENRTLTVREVIELPGPSASLRDAVARGTAVDRDNRRGVTQFADSLDDMQISRQWCVAEGDPAGSYRIRVFAGERQLGEFQFEVIAEATE